MIPERDVLVWDSRQCQGCVDTTTQTKDERGIRISPSHSAVQVEVSWLKVPGPWDRIGSEQRRLEDGAIGARGRVLEDETLFSDLYGSDILCEP